MRFLAVLTLCAVSVVGCAEREKAQDAPLPPPAATTSQPLAAPEKATPAKFSAIKDIRKVMPKVGAMEAPASSAAPSAGAPDAAP